MVSETFERYIKTIHDLEERKRGARTKDIARKLEVREASVTEMLQKLKDEHLVKYEPYRGATLTTDGKRLAEELTKKTKRSRSF